MGHQVQTLNALLGRVRRESLNGRTYLVANFISGVYCFLNTTNGKLYIGSAASKDGVEGRRKNHIKCLTAGYHCNKHFQNAWNSCGKESFEFIVLEYCPPEDCIIREQYWIDKYKSYERRYGYNICPTAGSRLGAKMPPSVAASNRRRKGIPLSSDHKAAIALGQTGSKKSEQARRNMTEAQNRPEVKEKVRAGLRNPVVRERLRIARLKLRHTPESRARMSKAHKGRIVSDEVRQRMAEAAKRRWQNSPLTEESRAKISAKLTGRKVPPEVVEKVANAIRGKKRSPESIAKVVAFHTGRKRSPETCKKISLAKRGML